MTFRSSSAGSTIGDTGTQPGGGAPSPTINTVGLWLTDGTADDQAGTADGTISGGVTTGLADLVDGGDESILGNGQTGLAVIPAANIPTLNGYALDIVAQAVRTDATEATQEVVVCRVNSDPANRQAGQVSIERRWNGSAWRLAAFTRNSSGAAVYITEGATPDAAPIYGVADWGTDAVRIHVEVEPTHPTKPTRLYMDGTLVAYSANIAGWSLNTQPIVALAYQSAEASYTAFSKVAVYRVRLRDGPLGDSAVATEHTNEPAVSISLSAPTVDEYDDIVTTNYAADLVSYWKFAGNGTDTAGTQDAVITGSVETGVPTIVDLDTIAEGAAADGEVIAFSGATGVYAQVPHNAAHKTAAGTVVITFQRDTASEKSTLLAASRATGGAAIGDGDFGIEIQANGAPRAFFRGTGNNLVELLGTAGDVALSQAYSIVFKWGTGGLSLALWNAAGVLVRRVTNALEDPVAGTSPIRFGVWHDGTSSPHDGPFGRVVWLDRRISDAEEEDLAQAKTIARSGTTTYTPFPFVTISNPSVSHSGISSLPTFNAANPRAASFTDPMGGLEVFRVTGDNGDPVLINGSTASGVTWTNRGPLPANNPKTADVWNGDATLMYFQEFKDRSGNVGTARSVLFDVDASHGNSVPWTPLRAASSGGLGDGPGVIVWWDLFNPLRMYWVAADGLYEWWPIGGSGNSVGQTNKLLNWPSGYGSFTGGRYTQQASQDGRYYVAKCKRNSDSLWGGILVDLIDLTLEGFVGCTPSPPFPTPDPGESNHRLGGTSGSGLYGWYDRQGKFVDYQHMITGAWVTDEQALMGGNMMTHQDHALIDGVDYVCGHGTYNGGQTGFWLWDIANGGGRRVSSYPAGGNHTGCRSWRDTFETYGGAGSGSSTGNRYLMNCRYSSNSGHPRGILAVRCGVNDFNQIRYLCNHRSLQEGDNTAECHPNASPAWEYVCFNSNWKEPGVKTSGDVHGYVCIIPDAFRSPNNDGS